MKVYYKKNSGNKKYISVVAVEISLTFGSKGLLISNEMLEDKLFDKNKFIQEETSILLNDLTKNNICDATEWIQDPYEIFMENKNKKSKEKIP